MSAFPNDYALFARQPYFRNQFVVVPQRRKYFWHVSSACYNSFDSYLAVSMRLACSVNREAYIISVLRVHAIQSLLSGILNPLRS